jgi:hypothetical protein
VFKLPYHYVTDFVPLHARDEYTGPELAWDTIEPGER